MPGHRLLELRLGRRAELEQARIQRVELEEVAVTPNRRTRAAVAGALPVVGAFPRAGRQGRYRLGQTAVGTDVDIVERILNEQVKMKPAAGGAAAAAALLSMTTT